MEFHRQGRKVVKLVKMGKEGEDYRHTCTLEDALVIAKEIANAHPGDGRGDVVTADFLRRQSLLQGMRNHTLYTAIDWLRTEGILKRHGRMGYSLEREGDLEAAIVGCWNNLTELE